MRTGQYSEQLIQAVSPATALIMQGGLNASKAADYPAIADRRQPLPLMRQVQIATGALVLCGTLAGTLFNPMLYIVPAFIGADLIFAGSTGICGMTKLLSVMPWNRQR